MRVHFRHVKDISAVPLHLLIKTSAYLPASARSALFGGLGLLAKAYYYAPHSHMRRTLANLCAVIGRTDGRAIWFEMVDNVMQAASGFGRLLRYGPDAVTGMCAFDDGTLAVLRKAWQARGGAILVVPHCVGSVLSAARFAREFPTVVLVRESRSVRRARLTGRYLEGLGAELIFVRLNEPTTVTRQVIRALKEKKLVIGTTDLARRRPDTIGAEMFGQRVWLPAWPARFAARRKVPIVAAYVWMVNGQLMIVTDEPYLEDDLVASTQRWAGFFERSIREYPADWIFMFEKRWSHILAAAAQEGRAANADITSPHED